MVMILMMMMMMMIIMIMMMVMRCFFFRSGHRRHERKNPSTSNRSWNYDLPVSIPDDDNIMMMTSSRHNIRKGYLTMNFFQFSQFFIDILLSMLLCEQFPTWNIFYTIVPARGWKKIQGPIPSLLSNTWVFFLLRLWI